MHDLRQIIQDDDYSFPYHYVPQFREEYTHTYSWPWGIYYASAMEFVLDRLALLNPEAIADVGTGDGRMVREINITLPNKKVIGFDYSERAIQLAKALNPTLEFYQADITKNTITERFDVITLIEVFEHIPLESANDFAKSIRRLLVNDGHLIVTVPHKNIPTSKKHFQHFSAEKLQSYFRDDFIVEKLVFLDKKGPVVSIVRWILENPYFILKHWGLRNRIYSFYKRHFLIADEGCCGRIFIQLRVKPHLE
jgi:2-polyprenyl-3-methyl-5-hydroxy-6-metoxy-1,4-benzoquinol methylase